jgi:hypothetical protein
METKSFGEKFSRSPSRQESQQVHQFHIVWLCELNEVVCKSVKNGKVLVWFSSATVGPEQRTVANLSGNVVAGIFLSAKSIDQNHR